LNGNNARLALLIAATFGVVLIVCMTAIVVTDKPIPPAFDSALPVLLAGVGGFLAGSRIQSPETVATIKAQGVTEHEAAATGPTDA
jgi:hypothetical protein